MIKRPVLVLLGTGLVLVTCLNLLYYLDKNKKSRQLLENQYTYLSTQNKYLERCLKYRLNVNGRKIPVLPDKDIVVYFSGKVCPSCVEKLLHLINDLGKANDRTLVLVNDSSKLDFIIGFNDGFHLNYHYLFDKTEFIEPKNEILIFKMEEGEVKCVLEFRPEEEKIFEEYFKLFFIQPI